MFCEETNVMCFLGFQLIRLWAEKEYHNLRRLHQAKIPCPEPILIKKHVLVMSLIGADQKAAPKLKEVRLSSADLSIAYEQVVEVSCQSQYSFQTSLDSTFVSGIICLMEGLQCVCVCSSDWIFHTLSVLWTAIYFINP